MSGNLFDFFEETKNPEKFILVHEGKYYKEHFRKLTLNDLLLNILLKGKFRTLTNISKSYKHNFFEPVFFDFLVKLYHSRCYFSFARGCHCKYPLETVNATWQL